MSADYRAAIDDVRKLAALLKLTVAVEMKGTRYRCRIVVRDVPFKFDSAKETKIFLDGVQLGKLLVDDGLKMRVNR